ncbi:MAG: hypothetical protein ACJAVT_002309 [Yoonia sp.]|jgi:hypothetical protein
MLLYLKGKRLVRVRPYIPIFKATCGFHTQSIKAGHQSICAFLRGNIGGQITPHF